MKTRIALAAAAMTLAFAGPAQADDASVFTAYTGHAAERDAANKAYIDAIDALNKGSATDDEFRAVIAANDQINAVIGTVRTETAAQDASTEKGTLARRLSLKEFALLVRNNVLENKALNAYLAGDDKTGKRLLKKQRRMLKTYHRTYTRAHRAWKAAGFKPPPAYGSDE